MRRGRTWLLLASIACDAAGPGDAHTDPPAAHTDPPEAPDTDPEPPVDTDRADDTEPSESDAPPDSDAPDTDPPLPAPPASWGGGFVELLGPVWAVDPLPVAPGDPAGTSWSQDTSVFFADLDRDGVPELVVATIPLVNEAPVVRVLRWREGALVDDPALAAEVLGPFEPTVRAPLAALDLDGDGWIDLIGGTARRAVRWGRDDGTWDPWVGVGDPALPPVGHALGLADLDDDGWLDLLLPILGCEAATRVALRTGPRRFEVRDDLFVGTTAEPFSWVVTTLEDGEPFVAAIDESMCWNVDPRPRSFRRTGWDADLRPIYEAYDPAPPNAWWKQLPAFAGRDFSALAPMGAGFDDLDGDGRLDQVISTGLAPQVLLRGRGDGTFEDRGGFGAYVRPTGPGYPEFPWSVAFPDLDHDGRPEILWTIGDDAGSFMAARGHPMRNAVSWNGGDFRFVDVEEDVGLVAEGSWRGLALADPDADGDADVATGGFGNAPAAWRNDVDVEGRAGVSLRLVGTTSNPAAIGARIEAHVAGLPVRHAAVGALGNRSGSSEPLLFVGAGTSPVVDLLRIRWPAGWVQELRDLPVGRLHELVEPPTIEVQHPTRRAVADGVARITVRITPRRPDGTFDPAPIVSLAFRGVVPDVSRSLARDAHGWSVILAAPRTPGVTAVVVRIDGVPLAIRPKLWWDPR